jgi:hypothetical protein
VAEAVSVAVMACRGAVLIDGVDLRDVPLQLLRERLTVIPQEPVLCEWPWPSSRDKARGSARLLPTPTTLCYVPYGQFVILSQRW